MELPFHSIHSCAMISSENAELKQKLLALKRVKVALQLQLKTLMEEREAQPSTASREFKHASVQTDNKYWLHRPFSLPSSKREVKAVTESDLAKTNKVLEMHSQLLKRYDKEVHLNMTYADSISGLNVKVAELESTLREERERSILLERQLIVARNKHTRPGDDDSELREMVRERNELKAENKKLKEELKGLDHNFFDEIEDLKFALLQSAKLNTAYEKFVRKSCRKAGEPEPSRESLMKYL